ncbi:MAG: type II toxin-antitoxin system HigB family toxin [Sediminibacterium sp.]
MKIHLIRRETIECYKNENALSRISFDEWLYKLKFADWVIPEDIKCSFGSADLLGKGTSRVVFDIGGNKYRLIAKYAFGDTQVHLFICWIGTHAEYDKLCKAGEQYIISNY